MFRIRCALLRACIVLLAAAALPAFAGSASAAGAGCPGGSTLAVVAHEDDDLLFLSPDQLHDVRTPGRCVRTVYLTAGDAGWPTGYWTEREAGAQAAYATTTGRPDAWTDGSLATPDGTVLVRTLVADPRISLVFFRLPDGGVSGAGSAATGYESLMRLRNRAIPAIHAVDGSAGYTKDALTRALSAVVAATGPDTIRTQDTHGRYGGGDHTDHLAAAQLAVAAAAADPGEHPVIGYVDYGTMRMPPNVAGADLDDKLAAFYAYGAHDALACRDALSCAASRFYDRWPSRQYRVAVADGPGWDPGCHAPALRGLTLRRASGRLGRVGCVVGAVRRAPSRRVPRGRVLVGRPSAAARHGRPGARVDLTLSAGRSR
jgi:LmbE family N-acetylglucosaminyl deacetylase